MTTFGSDIGCRRLLVLFATLLLGLGPRAAAAVIVPTDFVVENVTPGAGFDTPTHVAFLPGGRMLVAEKRGRVYAVRNGVKSAVPMVNLGSEVLNQGDRGLLAVAVDPAYLSNRYIYLLYTVDPDSNGTDNNDDAFGRLTRYRVSAVDSNVVEPGSRTILMGVDWRRGPASGSTSHTIGELNWGADGSLLVSVGDGAQFNQMDPGRLDPNLFGPAKTDPFEDIGSFRAQYLGSLAGKILRIDPTSGHGYPSNPFWDGNPTSARSRVWSYGLRNPFRFTVRPGTGAADPAAGNPGTLFIGDVGWGTYEEQNVAPAGGLNFGWPCYEGFLRRNSYQSATPAHHGCGTIGTGDNPSPHTPPLAAWHHDVATLSTPPGSIGNAQVGGAFYERGPYPTLYRGRYFFADFGQSWIKVARVNAASQLVELMDFASQADGPVDLVTDPATGDVVYVAINAGQVRRVRWTGEAENTPPTATADASPDVGPAPLTVSFSSAGSQDPDGDPLTYSWIFGDGEGAAGASVQHVYAAPGAYDAILSADDGRGGIARASVRVVAGTGSFPTAAVRDNFNRANGAIGGAWVDQTGGLAISANALVQTCCVASTVWNGAVFGPDQEAFVTLTQITPGAPEHDLLLKVQGTSAGAGHVEVRYDASRGRVQVSTHLPASGWTRRGDPIPVTFASGDQLGARAYSNGTVEVYRNGSLIGTRDVGDWPHKALGGRIGLTLDQAFSSRLDNFGGGNVLFTSNTPPTAEIAAPLDGAFYGAGETISLQGTASDAQQSEASLGYDWLVDVHHNNHVHPASIVASGPSASFTAEDHDDGTGVHYEIRLVVTDSGQLRDTTRVAIWPEIDLMPSVVSTTPATPSTMDSATWRFRIRNLGRIQAPLSRWRLEAGGTLLAEGELTVPARDSVEVLRRLPPLLAEGTHTVRVVVDAPGAVLETNEGNNAASRELTVVAEPAPDRTPPALTAAPEWTALVTEATVTWETDEPATGTLRHGATASLGDSVAVPLGTSHRARIAPIPAATRWYFRVVATDPSDNTRVGALDTLTTQSVLEPVALALSAGRPNPSSSGVSFRLELPRAATVAFAIHDVQGREVWSASRTELEAGRWELRWDGETEAGSRASAGVYLARVSVGGRSLVRRIALVR